MSAVESLANTDDVVATVDDMVDERELRRENIQALDETRDRLETAPEPDHVLDTDAKHEPEGVDAFEMTQTRRVGSVSMTVEGEGNVRFGKPSGRAGMDLLETLDQMQREGKTLFDQIEWAWATLAEWSLDDDHDADFWSNAIAGADTIALCRDVAMGGNVR